MKNIIYSDSEKIYINSGLLDNINKIFKTNEIKYILCRSHSSYILTFNNKIYMYDDTDIIQIQTNISDNIKMIDTIKKFVVFLTVHGKVICIVGKDKHLIIMDDKNIEFIRKSVFGLLIFKKINKKYEIWALWYRNEVLGDLESFCSPFTFEIDGITLYLYKMNCKYDIQCIYHSNDKVNILTSDNLIYRVRNRGPQLKFHCLNRNINNKYNSKIIKFVGNYKYYIVLLESGEIVIFNEIEIITTRNKIQIYMNYKDIHNIWMIDDDVIFLETNGKLSFFNKHNDDPVILYNNRDLKFAVDTPTNFIWSTTNHKHYSTKFKNKVLYLLLSLKHSIPIKISKYLIYIIIMFL